MILGMTLSRFTLFHVALSLVCIVSGFIVVYGLLPGKRLVEARGFHILPVERTA
jgi:hypothetical protein